MVMASSELMPEPESPLDVLSRAASMVESGASESESEVSPPRQEARLASMKEVHPKFRKHSASPSTPPPPSYSHSVATTSSSPEEAPLDFSIRKRSLSPSGGGGGGGPPYKYSNPLRQHSPPVSSHHLPVTPAPSYFRPPPYPRTPSPPPPPPPSDRRPPPPSYEAAMASKPVSPRVAVSTTSPTFMTLTTRPSPTTKAGSEYSVSLMTSSPTNKTDSHSRPSVICTGPSAVKKEDEKEKVLPVVNLFKKEENKENKESSADSEGSRKREVTIVEESGAGDLMEEHFRKSLGEDYSKVFKESEKKKVQQAEEENCGSEEMEVDPVKAFKEDLDMSGYTVEDHFAKALGDTWVKLQAEAEKKDKKPSSVSHKETAGQLLAL